MDHKTYTSINTYFKNRITTVRLAASYLAIIMVLSIAFSFVFYRTSEHALGRQLPSHHGNGIVIFGEPNDNSGPVSVGLGDNSGVNNFLQERYSEGRGELFHKLILLNFLALIIGALLSWYLARKSLEPIEAAFEAQSRFVSDASHELRTPLTAIRATNEVALRKGNLKTSEAKHVIESNLAEAIRLEALSDGLLKLARNQPNAMKLGNVDLSDVVGQAINNVLALAQAKKMTIQDNTTKKTVVSDKESLTQIITILLDNAIKYSPADKTVRITEETKGRNLLLHIKDEGFGIKGVDLPHIFERFYRADNSRTHQAAPGYGLGLSIAKKIIEQMGGEISVQSSPAKGSTFSVKLPAASALSKT